MAPFSNDKSWVHFRRAIPCSQVVYERTSSQDISSFGGLINNMPSYAFVFMIFTLGNIGLPGTSDSLESF